MSVYEFLQRDFVTARFKMKKNDLKFLGKQTLKHFPTSEITEKMHIIMKGVDKTVKIRTAFVDISKQLIAVIQEYRDNHKNTPYKDLGNKILSLTRQVSNDSGVFEQTAANAGISADLTL